MAERVLFHHAQGPPSGAGHTVHAPALYEGCAFDAGLSLGAQPVQALAQTRPGPRAKRRTTSSRSTAAQRVVSPPSMLISWLVM